MRRTTINLILIFAFLGSFGQNQQVLRNGFVAATDSGVYYLQDGFSEWVRSKATDSYVKLYTDGLDTILSVTTNGNQSCITGVTYSGTYGYRMQQGQVFNINIYNTFGGRQGYGGTSLSPVSGLSECKFKNKSILAYINDFYNTYSPELYIRYDFSGGDVDTYSLSFASSMCSDRDSILITVGSNNKVNKTIVSQITSSKSNTSISGLHSRSTDSHQICYNPNDDEFIIVSDSGIVYTYDKVTLTTVDTLIDVNGVYDIVYGGNYVYVIAQEDDESTYRIFSSSNLTSWNNSLGAYDQSNATISASYSDIEDKCLVLVHTDVGNSSLYWLSSLSYIVSDKTIDRSILDLDYINYNP